MKLVWYLKTHLTSQKCKYNSLVIARQNEPITRIYSEIKLSYCVVPILVLKLVNSFNYLN